MHKDVLTQGITMNDLYMLLKLTLLVLIVITVESVMNQYL